MNNPENILHFDLGFIGHEAEKLQKLFHTYDEEPNNFGYFLKFENYSELANNQGVICHSNCFESEEHFNERLQLKLLYFYLHKEII